MKWTPDMYDRLAKLWAADKTCKEIAAAFGPGFTRSQIIGQAHRRKLPARSPRGHDAFKSRSSDKTAERHVMPTVSVAAAASSPMVRFVGGPPRGAAAAVLALNSRMCRWPIGNPCTPDFHFCCVPKTTVGPYCDEHARLSRGAAA